MELTEFPGFGSSPGIGDRLGGVGGGSPPPKRRGKGGVVTTPYHLDMSDGPVIKSLVQPHFLVNNQPMDKEGALIKRIHLVGIHGQLLLTFWEAARERGCGK